MRLTDLKVSLTVQVRRLHVAYALRLTAWDRERERGWKIDTLTRMNINLSQPLRLVP